jgi:hypothetical protein
MLGFGALAPETLAESLARTRTAHEGLRKTISELGGRRERAAQELKSAAEAIAK